MGAAIRPITLGIILICTINAHAGSAWQYSPCDIWQSLTIYGLDSQGRAAMEKKPPNYSLAERCFQRVLRLDNNDYVAMLMLSRCYDEDKDPAAALAEVSLAIRAWPASSQLYAERSKIEL